MSGTSSAAPGVETTSTVGAMPPPPDDLRVSSTSTTSAYVPGPLDSTTTSTRAVPSTTAAWDASVPSAHPPGAEATTGAAPETPTTTETPAAPETPETTETHPAPETTTTETPKTVGTPSTTTHARTPTTTTGPGSERERSPGVREISVTSVEFMPGLDAEIHAPVEPGPYPVITLTFGRGWSLSDPGQLSALASYLAARGVVAINGDHRPLDRGGLVPSMVGEVACLTAAAPELARPHLTQPAEQIWMIGFSSGAHLAALAALADNPLPVECPHERGEIAGMIGLAGPYDLDLLWEEGLLDGFFTTENLPEGLARIAGLLQQGDRLAMRLFLRVVTGTSPENPELWSSLNPLTLAANHPERGFVLLTGSEDIVISDAHSGRLREALNRAGHDAAVETIPGADHNSLTHPSTVGETILGLLGVAP